jgi:hypothetical protein
MTETTEQIITRLAKERVKTILENGDFWGSPGAANTSATAITTLIAIGIPAVVVSEESPAAVVKEKRIGKAKEQAAATAEANDTDATDA